MNAAGHPDDRRALKMKTKHRQFVGSLVEIFSDFERFEVSIKLATKFTSKIFDESAAKQHIRINSIP